MAEMGTCDCGTNKIQLVNYRTPQPEWYGVGLNKAC